MQYFIFLSNLFDKTSVVNAGLVRARAVGKFSRVCSLIVGCFLWLASTAIGSTVLWTGTFDGGSCGGPPNQECCGYPYHDCGTSSGHLYYNIHWAGVGYGDNYYIFNDRGDLITIVGAVGSGSVLVDRGVFSMCDCVPGVYEAIDAIPARAGGYYSGIQLPVAGGDILTGVVTPGLSCTPGGCPPGTENVVTVDIYLAGAIPPSYLKCNDRKEGGDECKSCGKGMARYSAHSMFASLNIEDAPIGYVPPRGIAVNFTATYNQRDAQLSPTATYSNLGAKWSFNWLSYITDDPNTQLSTTIVSIPGGGTEMYQFDSGTQTFSLDPQSHAQLVRTSASTYERRLPGGSKQVFKQSDNATSYPRKIFMTQWVDAANNIVEIRYLNGTTKIDKIIDALSQETKFYYQDANNPYKITQVTDPFNRSAILSYTNGQLTSITDPVGIASQFHYVAGTDFIDSLTTPYGTSNFATGRNGTNRWIEMTDPLGSKERVEYKDGAISGSETVAPSGMTNSGLDVANTFYWDKKAYSSYPDYTMAKITHWAYNSDGSVSGIVASEKAPLENRVWYSYAGQSDTNHVGTSANPSQVARVLDDGTTQLSQYDYNSIGKTTKATDPTGRVTSYMYDTNNIDLLAVYQENPNGVSTDSYGAAADKIASYSPYNSLHEPLSAIDAAGQKTTYTYRPDGHGQIESVLNPKGELTKYGYGDGTTGPADYLVSITSPPFNGSSAVTSFTYDSANRVRTVTTSPDNYTVTTDYDNLDRPTQITYSDTPQTNQQFRYTKYVDGVEVVPQVMTLDLGASKDRRGRWTYREYDGNRHLTKVKEHVSDGPPSSVDRVTQYVWCSCGSLANIIDPHGHMTTFNRDLQSRVYQKIYADGTTDSTSVSYSYENTTSRLKSMTDALNQTTNYQYFIDDNLTEVSYTNALQPTPTVSFTYDPNYNRVQSMADGSGTTNYTYYAVTSPPALGAGQLETVDAPPHNNDTITYTYDELGRAVSQSINGVTSSTSYDSLGRLGASDDALGHFSRTYDGTGNLTSRLKTLTYPNGQSANYSYFDNSQDRRLQTLHNLLAGGAVNLSKFDYTYDAEGQIQTWAKQLGAVFLAVTGSYGYDLADEITSAVGATVVPTFSSAYGYDASGNRTTDQVPPGTHTFNNLNQTQDPGYTYDKNGNLTSDSTSTYSWDAANRLVAIQKMASSAPQPTPTPTPPLHPCLACPPHPLPTPTPPHVLTRSEFSYDGLGRRVRVVEKQGNPTGNPNWVTVSDHLYVWSSNTLAEERDNTGANVTKRFFAEGEQRIGSTDAGNYYYTRDHLGSIREMTDSSGDDPCAV